MGLDDIHKGINKALFKEFPSVTAFVDEIKEGGIDHINISVDIKYFGKDIARDIESLALDIPDGAQGRFHIVGEAFGPSGEKIASFREVMRGSVNYGSHDTVWNKRTDIFARQANRRPEEVAGLIKKEVAMSDPDKQIIKRPYVFGHRSPPPTETN